MTIYIIHAFLLLYHILPSDVQKYRLLVLIYYVKHRIMQKRIKIGRTTYITVEKKLKKD